jgi:RNA polymerase sigma-70 factor (ECF subfamily)
MLRVVSNTEAQSPTDGELVLAARKGDERASQSLYSRHLGWLERLVSRLLAGSPDVDDVVQDSFVLALTRLKSLKDPSSFGGWLQAIAVSQVRRRLRRKRLLKRLGFKDEEAVDYDALLAPHTPPEVVIELQQVYALLQKLPADEALALVLRRVEGLRLEEIAEQMQLSLATVKRRLTAAELHLSNELKET